MLLLLLLMIWPIYTQSHISPISMQPKFFAGRKAIARRSSSAARPMRTAAARRGHMDPQLASCKRSGHRADHIGRQLAAESSPARNARSGPNGCTSAGPPRKLKVGPRGPKRLHLGWPTQEAQSRPARPAHAHTGGGEGRAESASRGQRAIIN